MVFDDILFTSVSNNFHTLSKVNSGDNFNYQLLGALKHVNTNNIRNGTRRSGNFSNDQALNDISRLLCDWLNTELNMSLNKIMTITDFTYDYIRR